MIRVEAIDHVVIVTPDPDRSLAWYRDVLGLPTEREAEWRRGEVPFVSLRISPSAVIDVFRGERTGTNIDHFSLAVGAEVDLEAFAASGAVEVVSGPVRIWGARGHGIGIYVKDPDGNTVELKHYG